LPWHFLICKLRWSYGSAVPISEEVFAKKPLLFSLLIALKSIASKLLKVGCLQGMIVSRYFQEAKLES
jgi:hypothetical protein